jgi:hypothetical protein
LVIRLLIVPDFDVIFSEGVSNHTGFNSHTIKCNISSVVLE